MRKVILAVCFLLAVAVVWRTGVSHGFGSRLPDPKTASSREDLLNAGDDLPGEPAVTLPPGVQVERNISYGDEPEQKLDVYDKTRQKNAPVIVMVHGGGWRRGDKAATSVVQNKVSHWVPRGYVFVSVNYRMLPNTPVSEQAEDVGRAVAYVQKHAEEWGGDSSALFLMGHSAGAHLIALVASSDTIQERYGIAPWLGSVFLDSAALDVETLMEHRHLPLYDDAFGSDPENWKVLSPYSVLSGPKPPVLAVCSTKRVESCPDANHYADKAKSLGMKAAVLPENLTHREINENLGLRSSYTRSVDAFLTKQLKPNTDSVRNN